MHRGACRAAGAARMRGTLAPTAAAYTGSCFSVSSDWMPSSLLWALLSVFLALLTASTFVHAKREPGASSAPAYDTF